MTSALLALWVAASPSVELDAAFFKLALVPQRGALTAEAAQQAFKALSQKKGWKVEVRAVPREEIPGLDAEGLQYSGTKLPPTARTAVEKAKTAVAVVAEWPRTDSTGLKTFYETALQLAAKSDAVLLDGDHYALYTATDFRRGRVDEGWENGVLNAPAHFAIHSVALENNTVLLDTGGMGHFGLKELAINDNSRLAEKSLSSLINAVAQRLVEGARPDAKGRLVVKLEEIRLKSLREVLLASAYDNAKRQVVVGFRVPAPSPDLHEDDLELIFPDLKCAERTVCLDMATKELFGWSDSVRIVQHDKKLLDAKDKALKALRQYESAVQKGLPAGHLLMVKAGFDHPDGREWMWVAIRTWGKASFTGTLENEPEYVKTVAAGGMVTVQWSDAMDYIYQYPDGTFVGNETGKVMQPELFVPVAGGRWRIKEK